MFSLLGHLASTSSYVAVPTLDTVSPKTSFAEHNMPLQQCTTVWRSKWMYVLSRHFKSIFMWNEWIVHEIEHETPELADKCSNLSLMSAVSTEQLIKTTISSNFFLARKCVWGGIILKLPSPLWFGWTSSLPSLLANLVGGGLGEGPILLVQDSDTNAE